jgi:hypothetical protein
VDVTWFEMADVRRKKFDGAVWIPLRAVQKLEQIAQYGTEGHREEGFYAATLAVPLDQREAAEKLGWMDVGIMRAHAPWIDDGEYQPVEHEHHDGVDGVRLVLEQSGNRDEPAEWHLNVDVVIALALKREGDTWLAMDEGYTTVARLKRERGRPVLLEIRSEFLKDYLCARKMALLVSTFRDRIVTIAPTNGTIWTGGRLREELPMMSWEGSTYEVHEGGAPFGARTAVLHVKRTDVDPTDDVPTMSYPGDAKVQSKSWTTQDRGRKLQVIRGELWRTEWVEPGPSSPRIRRDAVDSPVAFIVDASGSTMRAAELREGMRWLWFRPEVINSLLSKRGGRLTWATRDTGGICCSPDYMVHFGVNDLGLVTVYAKDVATLPEWQQRIWFGSNVSPEGGVSAELLLSQVEATPADTQAPEAFIAQALKTLNVSGEKVCGGAILSDHDQAEEIIRRCHRFRSIDSPGFLALAKDLARISADLLNRTVLYGFLPEAKKQKLGSLKSLEMLVATRINAVRARELLGPLFAIYDLRLADAHLPGSLTASLELLKIDPGMPYVVQGRDVLDAFVSTLFWISDVLELPPLAA